MMQCSLVSYFSGKGKGMEHGEDVFRKKSEFGTALPEHRTYHNTSQRPPHTGARGKGLCCSPFVTYHSLASVAVTYGCHIVCNSCNSNSNSYDFCLIIDVLEINTN